MSSGQIRTDNCIIICPGLASGKLARHLEPREAASVNDTIVLFIPNLKPNIVMGVIETRPAAVLAREGGFTSHGASLLREAGIPTLSGFSPKATWFGKMTLINAFEGYVEIQDESR